MRKLIFIVILVQSNSGLLAQHANRTLKNDIKSVRQLISEKKIKGSIYDSVKFILKLRGEDGIGEYLVDSVFRLHKFGTNKIGFFCAFNDAASDIRFGYTEIVLSPYQATVAFLNNRIGKIEVGVEQDNLRMFVHTSSYPRDGEETEIVYLISSQKNKMFSIRTVSEKNKAVSGHQF